MLKVIVLAPGYLGDMTKIEFFPKAVLPLSKFNAKIPPKAISTILVLATLGDMTQIEMILYASHHLF
jgi:hypothetical protein